MKLSYFFLFTLLLAASPVLAQTSSRDMKGGMERPEPPAATEPSTSASPAGPHGPTQADASAEKVNPEKEAAIRHLLELTDESKMGQKIGEYVIAQVRDGMSNRMPADKLAKFMETFTQKFNQSASPSAITNELVLIYARQLTQEDIQALVRFYETPAGQRVMKAMPLIAQESQRDGLDMDRKVMMAVLKEMSEEYPELKPLFAGEQARPTNPPATPTPAPATPPAPAVPHP